MNIAVVGSREFKDIEFAKHKIYGLFETGDCIYARDTVLISGGAKGIDSISEGIVDDLNKRLATDAPYLHIFYKIIIFKAGWDKYGKRAEAIRNQLIVDEADKILAFWDGVSKGTKITIDMAIKAGKPLDIYIRN